ncbi:uncharacterized protein LOC125853077 [Solanum stenotomum]|uniref:uncharacterized protein LOC125853077 n=1 Tax=Solanum stenotomum TaxID=172797 RepID=UPI0020D120E5|nr:uncharacterized protein LOC125853077 [Solanum stenotomum]
MEESLIFTKIYHGGILSEISVPTYVGNCVSALRYIIKDHFSILELLYYTKELGYETVRDEPLLDTEGPRGYLTNVGGEGVDVDLGEEGEAVNLGGEGEAVDISGEGEAVNLGGEGVDVNIGEEGLGMVFEGANQFRKAVADYAVEYRRQIKLRPNEKHRVRVKCKNANCKWLLYASIHRDSGDFIVKNYHPVHKCIPLNRNKLCNSKLIARKFKDRIVSQPYIRIWEIQDLVRKTLGLYVGKTLCYRAKQRIMKENMGGWKVEFARLSDYADMIKQTNPGSSCWVKIDKEIEPGKNLFVYFYVCFHAFKQGWLEGCRNIIEFDGCFLKGVCKGELLVAVGKNGNNQMYPIAWAVVDTETKHSWSRFIRYLIADLNLGTGEGLTVMSDMQKGLIPVLSELLPNAEKRMCARHIWSNWHVNWKGEERRKQFWRCSKASF